MHSRCYLSWANRITFTAIGGINSLIFTNLVGPNPVKMKAARLLCLGLAISFSASAQLVTINKVELAGENIIVHYTLEDNTPNREYLLNLYSSRDNFASPLARVTGDVGPEVKPGNNKMMTWNVRQEYGGYKGKLALEIRGRVYVPFVKLQGFDKGRSFKKGKSYNINWRAGNANPIHLELYKGDIRVDGQMNQPNNGIFTLTIPSKVKTGKDYRLKITDSKNGDEVIYTPYFKVSPKLPMGAKAGLGLLVVGGAGLLLIPPPPDEGIPDPPFPSNN